MDFLSFIFALFPYGLCGLPSLLALAALIDAVRTGADWYWVPIVLFFPVIGPVAYFVVTKFVARRRCVGSRCRSGPAAMGPTPAQ